MKIIIFLSLIPFLLVSKNSNTPPPKINNVKVYEIDVDNKLALFDTTLALSQSYNEKYFYNDSTVILKLIEVTYPSISLLNFLKLSTSSIMDSTVNSGVTTYSFKSWCKQDTVDWDTDENGKLNYEIEYKNCKVKDTVKLDSKKRMIYYSYTSLNSNSGETYKFNDDDKLIEIDSPKGHFLIYYSENGRIDRIVQDYENIGNLIETMGSSMKREIVFKFEYE